MIPLALIAMLALSPGSVLARPSIVAQDTLRWTVLIAGNRAGEQVAWSEGEDQVIRFRFNDRGRGPDFETRIRLDARGLPVTLHTSGVDYFKNQVDETLALKSGRWTWRNPAEQGDDDRAGFYVSMNGSPAERGMLAAALLRAAQGSLPLLPAGEARITRAGEVDLEADGRRRTVHHYRIGGLGFDDFSIWLDANHGLFALVEPGWQAAIAEGWESTVPRLEAEQRALTARVATELARKLSRKPAGIVAITGARLFDARSLRVTPGMTVLVQGDRISAVGPDGKVRVPATAEIIAAAGRTLLPGLWDMHVHITGATEGMLHLAAGVTSVRDLANDVDMLRDYASRVERGDAIGPRITTMAGFLDGPGPFAAPTKALVATAAEVRQWIARYDSLGYKQIKLYSSLDTALVPVAIAEAHRRGMRVSGHVPMHLNARKAVELGFDELQHANFLFLNFLGDTLDTRTPLRFTAVARNGADLNVAADSVQDFIRLLKTRAVVVDPTVAVFEGMFNARAGKLAPGMVAVADRLPPNVRRGFLTGGLPVPDGMDARYGAAFDRMLELVGALHRAGVRVVAGTDAMPGFTLHRELELYVQAGIPAAEVLRLATLGAAEVSGHADGLGTIEPGKFADLVLVDGDPTQDISNIRNTVLVMKDGAIYEPNALYRALSIAPRAAANAPAR